MSDGLRLLDAWAPPEGHRLASVLATSYNLQADFFEEDVLPEALQLRTPAARGATFRAELEQALLDAEVTLFFDPECYEPGLRRSPRIDLVPLRRSHFPKLHAKIALLRFVPTNSSAPADQVVRLLVGSCNLTNPGYRNNIEMAACIDDEPGAPAECATAVRDAAEWLGVLVAPGTKQSNAQLRDILAVFAARPVEPAREGLQFVGLPRKGGLLPVLAAATGGWKRVTLCSPFWPEGAEPSDVVRELAANCGQLPANVRLLGDSWTDEKGRVFPVIPAAMVRALQASGAVVEVAAAQPGWGVTTEGGKGDTSEFDGVANDRSGKAEARRPLHAKALLLEGTSATIAAVGSFNFTRRGLGLHGAGNAEAGLLWRSKPKAFGDLFPFAGTWTKMDDKSASLLREPESRGDTGTKPWPNFLTSIRATREGVEIEGDGGTWPASVTLVMADIRGRQLTGGRLFDPWVITRREAIGPFEAKLPLEAGWIAAESKAPRGAEFRPLADLEADVSWDGQTVRVPVLFIDKDQFPILESRSREDERALIAFFLGLTPADAGEGDGLSHSVDPIDAGAETRRPPDSDIVSYHIRSFVHALPGVAARLREGALTETGLRTALLGPRSAVELAREVVAGWQRPARGAPRKSAVATAFQLVEITRVVRDTPLPELPGGITGELRREAGARIAASLAEVVAGIPTAEATPVVRAMLAMAEAT